MFRQAAPPVGDHREGQTRGNAPVVLGVLLRVDPVRLNAIAARLERMPAVTPFSVGEAERIGVLVEAESIGEAHKRLQSEIETIPDVWGAWPVFCHCDQQQQER